MISWSDWPARRRPFLSLFAAAVIMLVTFVLTTMDPMLALLAALLLTGLSAEALLPTRFTVSEQGVRVDNLFRRGNKPWDRISSWQHAEHGFLLRGARRVGTLRHRDLWIRCPHLLAEIELRLHSHLGEPAGELG